MKLRMCSAALAVALPLAVAAPTQAGGPGVDITVIRGTVEMKPLESGMYRWPPPNGRALQRVKVTGEQWRPATRGEVVGTYLLRTGSGSYAHLVGSGYCLDANSLVRVESGCGFRITVLKGRISKADGKRGKALPKVLEG
jgi:hypothetical protein